MLPWPWHIFLVREHMSHFQMIHIFMVDKTYKYIHISTWEGVLIKIVIPLQSATKGKFTFLRIFF